MCSYPVSPSTVAAISFWSKDFSNLIAAWEVPENAAVLNQYRHHFSFAINGPARTILEPGVTSPLYERAELQLGLLVLRCKALGQDPNASILVKVDPISVYRVAGEDHDRDTLGHIPYLCECLQGFGLTRLHISFTQFNFPGIKGRLNKLSDRFIIRELTPEQQRDLLATRVLPFTKPAGIQVQTCTAHESVSFYREHKSTDLIQGACCGYKDITSINSTCKMAFAADKDAGANKRHCTCYPHRDVGDKTEGCTHGCRYCFSNPKLYDF